MNMLKSAVGLFSLAGVAVVLQSAPSFPEIPVSAQGLLTYQAGGVSESVLEKSYSASLSQFKAHFSSGNLEAAIRDRRSLSAFPKDFFAQNSDLPSLDDLFLQTLPILEQSHKQGLARQRAYSLADKADITGKEKLTELEAFYKKENMSSALEQLYKRPFFKGAKNPLHPQSLSDLLNATVTIWVDRGLQVKGAYARPNRVIGSGFFIDHDGYLLTNYHVISSEVDPSYNGYSRLYIKRAKNSSEKIPARVIGWDKDLDLALLHVYLFPKNAFTLSQVLPSVGETVRALGSPIGLSNTVTSGTVSALHRKLQPLSTALQIDVPINPGNSGGPLIRKDGTVAGIDFAGIEKYNGINFAIPIEPYVNKNIAGLYKGGALEHSWLGVSLFDGGMSGVLVGYVFPESIAQVIGLQKGDVISAINGKKMMSMQSIQDALLMNGIGTIAHITVKRNGDPIELYAPLPRRPKSPMLKAAEQDDISHIVEALFGFNFIPIEVSGRRREYRIQAVYPGSAADDAGFSPNDVVYILKWAIDPKKKMIQLALGFKQVQAGYTAKAIQLQAPLESGTIA